MSKLDKSTKIIGAIALASTAFFLFKSRDTIDTKKIEGLNIDIDPEKMVDNIKSYISPDPDFNEKVSNGAKSLIAKLLG